jgi:hypothetical protein
MFAYDDQINCFELSGMNNFLPCCTVCENRFHINACCNEALQVIVHGLLDHDVAFNLIHQFADLNWDQIASSICMITWLVQMAIG